MKPSKLRIYVLQLLDDYQPHSFQNILDNVNSYFSDTTYTQKQVQDLMYNLARASKVNRGKKGYYTKAVVSNSSNSTLSNDNEVISMNNYIESMKKECISLKKYFDDPDLLPRLKQQSIDVTRALELYNANEQILSILCSLELSEQT